LDGYRELGFLNDELDGIIEKSYYSRSLSYIILLKMLGLLTLSSSSTPSIWLTERGWNRL